VNNKLPKYKPEFYGYNSIRSDDFKLDIIKSLTAFDKNCGYDSLNIEIDLSYAIGVKTYIVLTPNDMPKKYVDDKYYLKCIITDVKNK